MTNYHIVSSDFVEMGIFRGNSEAEALDAMAQEAGYEDQADAQARGIPAFRGTIAEQQDDGEWIERKYPR